jgi:putative peptidoglycan lipid II flippase
MATVSLGKTIFSVTTITLLSRLISLLSVQIYIARFGFDNIYLQVFMFALMLPNTIFTAIGTLLTTSVVPIYASLVSNGEEVEAKKFLDNIISISSIVMITLVFFGYILAPLLASMSSFNSEEELFYNTIRAIRILMPVMFFYGISFIFQGILQSHGKFNIIAAITIPSSLITIAYVFLLSDTFGIAGLTVVTLIALSSQAIFLLPAVIKTGYRFKISFDFKNKYIIQCFKMILPVLVGVLSYQINTFFNILLATNFNIVHINLVQNIILTSVLSFIYSITAIYYPKLSVLWGKGDKEEYKQNVLDIISILIFLLVPITFGFIGVRHSLFNLISNYGKVTEEDIFILGNLLAIYSLGVVSIGLKEVIDRAFYAQKNTKISAMVGFLIMAINIFVSINLMGYLGIYTMPVSYVISTTIGAITLLIFLRLKIGKFGKDIFIFSAKCLISGLIMLICVAFVNNYLNYAIGDTTIERTIKLFVPVVVGVITYFVMAYLFKIKQVVDIAKKILVKKGIKV